MSARTFLTFQDYTKMINVEIKAEVTAEKQEKIREFLKQERAWYGRDFQTDTYFNVRYGRLKLREGDIENALIFYERPDKAGPKVSKYTLTKVEGDARETVKRSLTESLGILVVVKKVREIYYLGNVKVHLDFIEGLGYFVEIEARDETEEIGIEFLTEQCNNLMKTFEIEKEELLERSYSDMLIDKTESEVEK